MTSNSYKHHALAQPDHIRVLVIEEAAADPQTPIECALYEISMTGPFPYSALSYSWGMDSSGDATPNRSILIHGKPFAVTRNLFECLLRLRGTSTRPRGIWVDAACIDQSDVAERNSQVAMMAEIYRNAARTFIWLGEGDSERDSELEWLIQTLAGVHTSSGIRRPLFLFLAQQGETKLSRLDYMFGRVKDPKGRSFSLNVERWSSDHTKGVSDMEQLLGASEYFMNVIDRRTRLVVGLVSRRYWSRRWVIQEIHFSSPRDTWIHFGGSRLRLDHLAHGFEMLNRVVEWFYKFWAHCARRTQPVDVWSPRTAGLKTQLKDVMRLTNLPNGNEAGSLNIAALLSNYWQQDCKDPRDRIYALASMASIHVPIDYSVPAPDLFTAFAAKLIQNERTASWLLRSTERKAFAEMDDLAQSLPSWVPDFRGPLERYDDKPTGVGYLRAEVIGGRILRLKAWMLGTIRTFDDETGQWIVESDGVPVLKGKTKQNNATLGDLMISPCDGTFEECVKFMQVWLVRRDFDPARNGPSSILGMRDGVAEKYRFVDHGILSRPLSGEHFGGFAFEEVSEGMSGDAFAKGMPVRTFHIV